MFSVLAPLVLSCTRTHSELCGSVQIVTCDNKLCTRQHGKPTSSNKKKGATGVRPLPENSPLRGCDLPGIKLGRHAMHICDACRLGATRALNSAEDSVLGAKRGRNPPSPETDSASPSTPSAPSFSSTGGPRTIGFPKRGGLPLVHLAPPDLGHTER